MIHTYQRPGASQPLQIFGSLLEACSENRVAEKLPAHAGPLSALSCEYKADDWCTARAKQP